MKQDRELESWKNWRRVHRQILAWVLATPIITFVAILVARSYPFLAFSFCNPDFYGAGGLSGVWKGWLEKPPKGSDGS